MRDTYARGLDGKIIYRHPEGYSAPNGMPVNLPQADNRREQKRKELESLDPIEAAKKSKDIYDKAKGEVDRIRKAQQVADDAVKAVGGVAKRFKPNPVFLAGEVGGYVFEPQGGSNATPNSPDRPAFPPPLPNNPMPKPPGNQTSICGVSNNGFTPSPDKPNAVIAEFSIYRAPFGTNPLFRIGSAARNTTRAELEPFKFGIVQVYCPDGYQAMFPDGEGSIFTIVKPREQGFAADTSKPNSFWRIDYSYDYYVITGTDYKWMDYRVIWGFNDDMRAWANGRTGPPGSADSGGNYQDHMWLRLDCIVKPNSKREPVVKPNDYNRKNDEEEVACKWQTDEIDYALPELKIGDDKIGGTSIKIDDGLVPLANFLVKSIEMMHKGIGLDKLDTEFPVSVMKQDGDKVKPKSLAELSQWQFDNVSSLVGLPVVNTITSLDAKTKDLTFKNIQDCLSYLVHHQRESDNDLMVLEGYATRTAQQLEAVTQICLRQHADIEMMVKEMGFRWKWKTEERKSLYKLGIKDDDKETGVLELFKGGKVTFPIRVWDDKLDARQIAMTTNLYSELASKSNYHSYNSSQGIPGLDARTKMNKGGEEEWKEFVKTVNEPALGVLNGSSTPFIEEYTQGTVTTKKVSEPASGLSLFMKPKTSKTAFKPK